MSGEFVKSVSVKRDATEVINMLSRESLHLEKQPHSSRETVGDVRRAQNPLKSALSRPSPALLDCLGNNIPHVYYKIAPQGSNHEDTHHLARYLWVCFCHTTKSCGPLPTMRLRTYGWKHSVTAVDVRVRAPCNGKGKARLTTQTTSGLRPASDEVATWPDSENGARLEDTEFSLFQRLSGVRLDT